MGKWRTWRENFSDFHVARGSEERRTSKKNELFVVPGEGYSRTPRRSPMRLLSPLNVKRQQHSIEFFPFVDRGLGDSHGSVASYCRTDRGSSWGKSGNETRGNPV